jgi:glutamine---fructose-6-phosphate transaminase (isomerizing)
MCGIFGLIQKTKNKDTGKIFRDLFLLSESRGKEAAGFAIKESDKIRIHKTPFPASTLVKSKIFTNEIVKSKNNISRNFIGIGHSRLVTNGYEQFDINNQPVVKNGMIVIHNGIIVNQNRLWDKYGQGNRISDLDSELIPTIIKAATDSGRHLGGAVGEMFREIYGMTNIAFLSDKYDNLVLATNNGSIYYLNDLNRGIFIFASERYILVETLRKRKLNLSTDLILQLHPGELISINLKLFSFQLAKTGIYIDNIEENSYKLELEQIEDKKKTKRIYINTSLNHETIRIRSAFIDEILKRKEAIDGLKRCTKCILPETFPFIEFDETGVCNFCNNYHRINYKSKEALQNIAEKYHNKNGNPECLIPFSGGRDSSYALHYVVKELKLKPIAFSYDWGMLTDLARRNQARICGNLGIEHILVSADIRKKRENIRMNVRAWLKRPNLGTVPLFMAGDKQYFYFSNLLMKQNNLKLSILGENLLEKTNFKTGFCGIKPKFTSGNTYSLSFRDKLKMVSHYGKQYFLNPAYINSSLFDTVDSFKSYYIIKHQNLNIYDYIKWDEKTINHILINKYGWETDPGTNTTWRIGDGTAGFYNFIYYIVAGFSENDTFRSNQIREGDLTRKEALELAKTENKPRWDSIQWYCRTIGIDFNNTVNTIKQIPSLF